MTPSDPRDDGMLLAGDAADFGRFYAAHEDFVLGFFLRRTGRAELAADLTAETFARVLAARHRFDGSRGEPRAWVTGIARHVLSDSLEHGRVEDRVRRKLALERLHIDDEAIARIHGLTGDLALAALNDLPDDQQLAVQGRIVDQATYDELAQALRCSPSVVRQRVSRGLRTLRERLKETG